MNKHGIVVQQLASVYKTSGRGIKEATFLVEPGEIMGILGSNGSGKSTLIRTLAGYQNPTAGWYTIGGYDSRIAEAAVGNEAGIVFETSSYFEDLTGRENIAFVNKLYKQKAFDEEIVKELFLSDALDIPMKNYSFGMRRKVDLAEAILRKPKVLILDEPFTGLDYASKYVVQERLQRLAREGSAILLTTNEITEAESICDTVAFVHQGTIINKETVTALLADIVDLQEIDLHLKNFIAIQKIGEINGVKSVAVKDGRVRMSAERGALAEIIRGIVDAGGDICDIRINRATLADVFLQKTGIPLQ